MRSIQWFVLAIACFFIATSFMKIDLNNGFKDRFFGFENPCTFMQEDEQPQPLDKLDVMCVLGGEIYEPFIYLFNILGFVFIICGSIEIYLEQKK
ncbi:MAG: hypothetical protein KJ939_00855 [Nanoarchaeota archaeon]|nr:hypothetical protein [Nanoarchaeota archaeon]MCG2719607.1 hypothetical protein [Nanoarchaeota archaeon]